MVRIRRELINYLTILFIIAGLCSCKEVVVEELKQDEALKVQILLSEFGIESEKIKDNGQWQIQVNSNDVSKTLLIVDRSRVLTRRDKGKHKNTGLLSTKPERDHALERDLSKTLENTLQAIPGVYESRVHLYFHNGNSSKISNDNSIRSASVMLLVGSDSVAEDDDVKKLIAGATGLDKSSVSAVLIESNISNLKVNLKQKSLQSLNSSSAVPIKEFLKSHDPYALVMTMMMVVVLLAILIRKLIFSNSEVTNSLIKPAKS